jgi:hypothetical protein
MTIFTICVDIIVLVEGKEVGMALLELRQPFGLGDLRADILNDALAFSQVHPGKAADAVDAGGLEEPEGMIQGITV